MVHSRFTPQISVGQVIITPAAAQRLSPGDVTRALRRHARGDQGDFASSSQRHRRGVALLGCRFLSAYRTADGTRFWIISEADQSQTTVLLPDDF